MAPQAVHGLLGFPMASIAVAAYSPLFWLHHCNIDRLYEAYLQLHPDSRDEMAHRDGAKREYDTHLAPFKTPYGEPTSMT
jgi:hypothetical protein